MPNPSVISSLRGSDSKYTDVGAGEALPPGSTMAVKIHGDSIGLYNVDGQIFAMDDLCTHDDAYLSDGDFDPSDGTVRCPRHSSRFDVRTGKPRSFPAVLPVEVYEAKIEQGRILVLLAT